MAFAKSEGTPDPVVRRSGPVVQRCELYWLKDGGTEAEKNRPIVIVSRDDLNAGNSVLAVPFYSQQLEKRRNQKFCASFNAGDGGLPKDCVAKCDEITLLDKDDIDFVRGRMGRFNGPQMERVIKSIRYALRDESP